VSINSNIAKPSCPPESFFVFRAWTGDDPLRVIATLLDVLVRILDLDFADRRTADPASGSPREQMRSHPKMKVLANEAKPSVVALDLSGVPDLEYTALKMLISAEKEATRARGGRSGW
jgi:hypothetical protein